MAFKNIAYKHRLLLIFTFVVFAGIIIAAPFYYNPFIFRSFPPLYLVSLDSSLYRNSPLEVRKSLAEGLERIAAAKPKAVFCFYPLSYSCALSIDQRIKAVMDKTDFYASVPSAAYIERKGRVYLKSLHPPAAVFGDKYVLGHSFFVKKGNNFFN